MQNWECGRCRVINVAGANFCSHCGTPAVSPYDPTLMQAAPDRTVRMQKRSRLSGPWPWWAVLVLVAVPLVFTFALAEIIRVNKAAPEAPQRSSPLGPSVLLTWTAEDEIALSGEVTNDGTVPLRELKVSARLLKPDSKSGFYYGKSEYWCFDGRVTRETGRIIQNKVEGVNTSSYPESTDLINPGEAGSVLLTDVSMPNIIEFRVFGTLPDGTETRIPFTTQIKPKP